MYDNIDRSKKMISEYLGFDSDYIILGLAGVVIILLILIIINMVQTGKLKKRYKVFMKNCKVIGGHNYQET